MQKHYRPHYMARSALAATLVVLAACTDVTSDVGADLLETGTTPEVVQALPAVFEQMPHRDITGSLERMLAGHVVDEVAGTIRATGYADFSGGFDPSDASAISAVDLRLVRNYLYGDTLADLTLDLHDILGSWEALGGRADTLLELGPRITSFTFPPGDTLVAVPLPRSWIDLHVDALRSPDFDDRFHGLAFVPGSEGGVGGFSATGSELIITSGGGTVSYNLSRAISRIERLVPAAPPEGTVLLQDGSGPSIRIGFDLEEFMQRPLNGATVRLSADAAFGQMAPAHFVRPSVETLHLVMVPDEGAVGTVIAELVRRDGHVFEASGLDLAAFFQDTFVGAHDFAYLELRVPVQENTVNALLLHDATSGELAPEALFVFSR